MLGRRSFLGVLGLGALFSAGSTQAATGHPKRRKIHLIDTYIAGFQYYDGMGEGVARSLQVGDEVMLKRQPDNRYDENAIEVYTPIGHKLGYLPRSDNTGIAAIADQDVQLGARVSVYDLKAPPWERITVSVYEVIST